MFRKLETQAFSKKVQNPVDLDMSKVEKLLAQEWETFKSSTIGSSLEFQLASQTVPLGSTSSFQHWDPYPLSIASASGAWMVDVDGRELLDMSMGFGAMLAGHLNPVVVEEIKNSLTTGTLFVTPSPISRDGAERICRRFGLDQVRFTNSGTEATMYAVRLAKIFSKKDAVVKVEGGYHGSYDPLMTSVKPPLDLAGPADAPHSVYAHGSNHGKVFVVPYNNLDALEKIFAEHHSEIATFILEPVIENLAIVLPVEGYLAGVRQLCDKYNIVLIFDEVKTGLTAGPHGAAQRLGVTPDLITLAKSIGGGVPVAAFGGKREIMDLITTNHMAHFGTFNGNPLAMAGVRAMDKLATTEALGGAESLNVQALTRVSEIIDEYQLPAHTMGFGIKGCINWRSEFVRNYRDYKDSNFKASELSWLWSLNRGIMTPPGQDDQWLISLAHGQREIDILVEDFRGLAEALRG
jgi:glutamate-1-semialdehyde 2,1-aminomutase